MQVFQKNDKVQVLQNVGNIGPHWIEAEYIQKQGNRHYIRTIDGDFPETFSADDNCVIPETFSADDNCVNKNCKYAAECKKVFCLPPP